MKRYRVKGSPYRPEYLTVVNEADDGYSVTISTVFEYGEEKRQEFIPKELFDSCVRTNYFTEVLVS